MKKNIGLLIAVAVAVFASAAQAMPSQDEINNVQPLVAELMKPSVTAFKAKKMSGSEVGDKALKLAEEAEGEAAKFLCMKGAVTYYVKDKEYDKAAEAIESIMAQFPDMPPETLLEITSAATKQVQAKSAPKLSELHKTAGRRVANGKKLRTIRKQLKETPADKGLIRQYAELNAANGNWEEALKHFVKLGGDIGKMAKNEMEGNASAVALAGFWWDYKAQEAGAKSAIRQHAAEHYRAAVDSGELTGLNKTLAEQRIAEAETANSQLQFASVGDKFSKGLVGYWKFDGDAKDASGKRNHGVLHDVEPVEDRFGQANKAYRFNDKKYIEVPNSPSLQGLTKNVTICAWVRPTAWWLVKGKGFMIILQKGDQKNRQFNALCYDARTYFLDSWSRENTNWKQNEWQHFAATYEYGKLARFYKNGVLNGEASADKEIVPNNLPLLIGYDPYGASEYLIGDMDDLRIYNRVLSEQEIQELYKSECP